MHSDPASQGGGCGRAVARLTVEELVRHMRRRIGHVHVVPRVPKLVSRRARVVEAQVVGVGEVGVRRDREGHAGYAGGLRRAVDLELRNVCAEGEDGLRRGGRRRAVAER